MKRTADQDVLVADARLSRVATQLDAVKVQADRQKVGRDANAPDISGSERRIDNSGVPANQLGDLAALAASLPGVQLIPNADGTNGFSVLGLTADQNATTLNGMNFGGSQLPRDAQVSTSLATSLYDVSRGNFSGGVLNVRAGRASNFIVRSNSLNVDAPQMQWTDAAARALGQQYTNVSLGGSLAGPIQPDKSFFTFAYQGGRRLSDLQSLLNTSPIGLQTIGISTDSVNHLMSTLGRWGVPTSTGAPRSRYQDNALVFSSLDFTPPTSVTGQAFNLTFSGNWNRQDPSGFANTELPSHSGERANWNLGVFGRHSSYFGFGVLTETSVGVNQTRLTSSPFVDLPNASVRINSTFADGTPSVQTVAFGGNPAMNIGVTQTSAQFMNALSWFSENNKHRIKYTTELRRDQYAQDLTTNQLGTFSYNSLADLDAGRPAVFSRQLTPRKRSEGVYIGGLSLGDSYRPSDDLQVQYGLRVDGNRFTAEPLLQLRHRSAVRCAQRSCAEQGVPEPAHRLLVDVRAEPADRRLRRRRARSARGDARRHRRFQSTPNASTIGQAMDNTGLATGAQQLVCVGAAAPTPDWAAYIDEPWRGADAVRERRGEHGVRQHGAQRHDVRSELPGAARDPLEPQLVGHDARQSVPRERGRDVFAQREPAGQLRSELQPGRAASRSRARATGRSLRNRGEHRLDDRRDLRE